MRGSKPPWQDCPPLGTCEAQNRPGRTVRPLALAQALAPILRLTAGSPGHKSSKRLCMSRGHPQQANACKWSSATAAK